LNAAITRGLVGVYTEALGRGPKSASTFHHNNVVVTLMHEVLSPADRALAGASRDDEVVNIRRLYRKTMQAGFTAVIESLTGRGVIAFISGNNVDPDIAAEIFILDASL
jgi:uncharacterized protein YbcI